MVQHHGVNPYRYFPGNEHLKALREDDIFPNINRRDYAPTIYPPLAQIFFFCVTWVGSTLTMMKLAMMAMEAVTVYAVLRLLEGMGRRREEVILYAWESAVHLGVRVQRPPGRSGHCHARARAALPFRNQPVLTGLTLGAAVMFKFYPLVVLPALWRRRDWKMPAALTAVVVAGYAVYAGVGMKVFGFAGGYAAEEGMDSGSRFFLLDAAKRLPGLHSLPNAVYLGVCVVVFGALTWWCWQRSNLPLGTICQRTAFLQPASALAFALMLLFAPHYPWYVAWLLPFVVLRPNLPMLVYTCSVFYWLTTQYAEPGPKMFFANSWIYGATVLAVLPGGLPGVA